MRGRGGTVAEEGEGTRERRKRGKSSHLRSAAAAAPRGAEQHHAVARRLHPPADLVGSLPRVDDDALRGVLVTGNSGAGAGRGNG